jgi:hypothetical protein
MNAEHTTAAHGRVILFITKSVSPAPEICQEKKEGGMQHFRHNPISVAIPSFFGQPIYLTIPLVPVQREQPLRMIEKSGWRDGPGQQKTHPRL